MSTQPKLLRVLQEHTFERLGGTQSIAADFRIVAATNRLLDEEVAAGRFRADLFFRLNVVPIELPPLRNRRPDVLLLAEHFLAHYSNQHQLRPTGFAEDAILKLQSYRFPGNVRELEHIVERSVLLAGGRAITGELLLVEEPAMSASARKSELELLLQLPFRESVHRWERLLIERALKAANGKQGGSSARSRDTSPAALRKAWLRRASRRRLTASNAVQQ